MDASLWVTLQDSFLVLFGGVIYLAMGTVIASSIVYRVINTFIGRRITRVRIANWDEQYTEDR